MTKNKMKKFASFCKKPMVSKLAILLSSFAVTISLYSALPMWHDERPMPNALKKNLH